MTDLPWHKAQWTLVRKQLQSGRQPHALLLIGSPDLGKRIFAHTLAASLLCREPVMDSDGNFRQCNVCSSCHLLNAGTHPDFLVIQPEESKQILIDQIRLLNQWVAQTSGQGGEKVALLYPAEQMNIQAANALLKSLEEPTPGTLFILVSDNPARLLPTIMSRCQFLSFPMPPVDMALSWLKENGDVSLDLTQALAVAGGSPLKALRDINGDFMDRRREVMSAIHQLLLRKVTSLDVGESLLKYEPLEVIRSIQSIVDDAVKYLMTGDQVNLANGDSLEVIRQLGSNLGVENLFAVSDKIHQILGDLESTSNPNPQLLIESLLISCTGQEARPPRL